MSRTDRESRALEGAVWITWERQRRSVELANDFGARLYVLAGSSRDIGNRALRYAMLTVKTVKVLMVERPRIVFAQNPSVVLAALLCALRRVGRYYLCVDRHSNFKFGESGGVRMRVFQRLSRFTVAHADLTIVTNQHLAHVVNSWGGKAMVLQDRIPTLDLAEKRTLGVGIQVIVISGFGSDEPVGEVLEAAGVLGAGYRVSFTGDPSGFLRAAGPAEIPSNVAFLGFLNEVDYQTTLASADVVVVLSKKEYLLPCGAYEAMALGKATVLSATETIREYFGDAAVYAEAKADSIATAVKEAVVKRKELERAAEVFCQGGASGWSRRRHAILERIRTECGVR
jgi:glycosyltransferase involved in cell wall biosynthesis